MIMTGLMLKQRKQLPSMGLMVSYIIINRGETFAVDAYPSDEEVSQLADFLGGRGIVR